MIAVARLFATGCFHWMIRVTVYDLQMMAVQRRGMHCLKLTSGASSK